MDLHKEGLYFRKKSFEGRVTTRGRDRWASMRLQKNTTVKTAVSDEHFVKFNIRFLAIHAVWFALYLPMARMEDSTNANAYNC
jgi:hypothetical protein